MIFLIATLIVVTMLPQSVAIAQIDRTSKWMPNPNPFLAIEWRYAAGRITDGPSDYGFVISVSDVKLPGLETQELLVERQDFTGSKAFDTESYSGTLTYDSGSATYEFQAAQSQASATWQWVDAQQVYSLTVTSPELNLPNVVLRPQGDLIPEGGDGVIDVGEARGFQIGSDYHADWTRVEIGGVAKGFARVDMQGLYPVFATLGRAGTSTAPIGVRPAQAEADYDHHWFAVAGQLEGAPVWITAWRIETQNGPLWDVTIARGSGANWQISWTTEEDTVVAPLSVQGLLWQPAPAVAGQPALRTGTAWRITAGQSQPRDLIDLRIEVPPEQFVTSARIGSAGGLAWIEEGVGTKATGTVLGQPLNNVSLVVAESTAEFYVEHLPLVRR
jgi:hypothetical protein